MLSITQIAQALQGQLFTTQKTDPNTQLSPKVTIDSRDCAEANIFVAIAGENHDGHIYVQQVAQQVQLVIVSNADYIDQQTNYILVKDTVKALGDLAKLHVENLNLLTIGITGSAGKTTTKDLMAQLLIKHYGKESVVFPKLSFNNEIGMPLTALQADENTKVLVLEMGASAIGELAYLTSIVPLDYAVVLLVGTAHLGGFGSIEAIASAKAELVQGLKPSGVAVLNMDDEKVYQMRKLAKGYLTFSASGKFSDIWAENITKDELNRPVFDLCTPSHSAGSKVSMNLLGKHNVSNALAVAAVMQDIGMSLSCIAQGLSEAKALSPHRLYTEKLSNGTLVIDDAYNANPDSMKAGLKTLSEIIGNNKGKYAGVAVLGQMLELGRESTKIHLDLQEVIENSKIEVLITVGENMKLLTEKISENKVIPTTYHCSNIIEVEKILEQYLNGEYILFFKGSNGSNVWRLADKVIEQDMSKVQEGK